MDILMGLYHIAVPVIKQQGPIPATNGYDIVIDVEAA